MTKIKKFIESKTRLEKPFISVIIPCYNYSKFLFECVESIIKQKNFSNFEIIIINDESPDNTSNVANKIIDNYENFDIKFYETENQGVSATRNFGVSKSKGEWIFPLDADDKFRNGFFDKCIEIIQNDKNINLIFSDLDTIGTPDNWEWIPPNYTFETLAFQNTFPYCSLHKRELFEKTKGYNQDIPWGAEDWEYWLRCGKIGLNPYRLKERYFLYRVNHSDSNLSKNVVENYSTIIPLLRTLHPDIYDVRDLNVSHKMIGKMNEQNIYELLRKLDKNWDHSYLYFWIGLYFFHNKRIDDAIKFFELSKDKVLEFDWQPFIKLAELYKIIGEFEKSKIYFEENKLRREKAEEKKMSLPW